MSPPQPLQWNLGAWIGSLAGMTAWMARLAYQFYALQFETHAILMVALFAVSWLVGACIYRIRSAVPMWIALQGLCLWLIVSSVVVIAMARSAAIPANTYKDITWIPVMGIGLIGLFAVLMAYSRGRRTPSS